MAFHHVQPRRNHLLRLLQQLGSRRNVFYVAVTASLTLLSKRHKAEELSLFTAVFSALSALCSYSVVKLIRSWRVVLQLFLIALSSLSCLRNCHSELMHRQSEHLPTERVGLTAGWHIPMPHENGQAYLDWVHTVVPPTNIHHHTGTCHKMFPM